MVLCNLKEQEWTCPKCYSPMLCQDSLLQLLHCPLLYINDESQIKVTARMYFVSPPYSAIKLVIVTPLPPCPIFPPGTYWKQCKTLVYGLRQSPCHWFYNLQGNLLDMGCGQCIDDPCIFVGTHPDFLAAPIYWMLCGRVHLLFYKQGH